MNIVRFLQGFGMGLVMGSIGILLTILFILTSPSSVYPEMATEVFRVLSEIDGVLIGFTGIIAIFMLKGLPKKSRFFLGIAIILIVIFFIISVLFNIHGLMHVKSDPISSKYFIGPIIFLIGGIFSLAYTLFLAPRALV